MRGAVLYGPRDVRFDERRTPVTHIAIQERLNHEVVEWMEHVTDEEYRKLP